MSQPFPAACVYLSGPTASGKTAIALELAKLLDAEIVAMDSMTLYRKLDIGTAKPTPAEREAAPHHLLDLVEPDAEFSQAEYVAAAKNTVDAILARGRIPLFVGGTPLYLKTLLRGMFEGPPADWELRRALEAEARNGPPGRLHAMLHEVDPIAAAKLHANDERRLIRALEVYRSTGMPISAHQSQFEQVREEARGRVFVLDRPREKLYERINARVDTMLADGLLDEVRKLIAEGQAFGRTASQALGYREALEYLAGNTTEAAMVDAIKQNTRRFAKRQLTWFRSLPECRSIPMDDEATPAEVAVRIFEIISESAAKPQANDVRD
ncbi:MAG: tRNA (adenosine(37)-N6)-dimethylallyltransferase MiaA [Planctomycetia bacterium]|nr:tRNA (adenosine(37)-N6)-dimethylallyltransferase MiaA [Planctomycetia bacterium]